MKNLYDTFRAGLLARDLIALAVLAGALVAFAAYAAAFSGV